MSLATASKPAVQSSLHQLNCITALTNLGCCEELGPHKIEVIFIQFNRQKTDFFNIVLI